MSKPLIPVFDNHLNVPYLGLNLITSVYSYTACNFSVMLFMGFNDEKYLQGACFCHMSLLISTTYVGVRRYPQHTHSTVNFDFVAYSFTQPSGGSFDVACKIKKKLLCLVYVTFLELETDLNLLVGETWSFQGGSNGDITS